MKTFELSDDQILAATSPLRRLLVEAEPGSGKTLTVVERAGLLATARRPGDARGVVCVSFTRAAVSEIRNRLRRRWGVAAAARPDGVMTFDHVIRLTIRHLIAIEALRWFGCQAGDLDESLDDWAKTDGSKQINKGKPQLCVTVEGGTAVLVATTEERRIQGFAPDQEAKYHAALGSGLVTHRELRSAMRSLLEDDQMRKAVGSFVRSWIGHLLVDEAFDCNADDRRFIELCVDARIPVTLVGDEWQALYEWRGSEPGELRRWCQLNGFRSPFALPAKRFQNAELQDFASRLRAGLPVLDHPALREVASVVDMAVARNWEHLWFAETSGILPLSFVSPYALSLPNAVGTLLLNHHTVERAANEALGLREAMHALRLSDVFNLGAIAARLGKEGENVQHIFEDVARSIVDEGGRNAGKPTKPVQRKLGILANRLRSGQRLIPGITIHQAKGHEWDSVLYVADLDDKDAFARGLRIEAETDRTRYVGLTRARHQLSLLKLRYAESEHGTIVHVDRLADRWGPGRKPKN